MTSRGQRHTVLQLDLVLLVFLTGVSQEVVFVQSLSDEITEVSDGVDHSGLLRGTVEVLFHQIVLHKYEV